MSCSCFYDDDDQYTNSRAKKMTKLFDSAEILNSWINQNPQNSIPPSEQDYGLETTRLESQNKKNESLPPHIKKAKSVLTKYFLETFKDTNSTISFETVLLDLVTVNQNAVAWGSCEQSYWWFYTFPRMYFDEGQPLQKSAMDKFISEGAERKAKLAQQKEEKEKRKNLNRQRKASVSHVLDEI